MVIRSFDDCFVYFLGHKSMLISFFRQKHIKYVEHLRNWLHYILVDHYQVQFKCIVTTLLQHIMVKLLVSFSKIDVTEQLFYKYLKFQFHMISLLERFMTINNNQNYSRWTIGQYIGSIVTCQIFCIINIQNLGQKIFYCFYNKVFH